MEAIYVFIVVFWLLVIFGTMERIKSDTDKINKKLDQYIKSQKDAKQWKQ